MSRKFKTSLSEERLLVPDSSSALLGNKALSQSFTTDTDMSQLMRMRKKRRLPPILLRRRQNRHRNFWPTYRGAVEWLRKREADLNTAIGLLELYPNLIQESPLDGLWEFLRPLLSQLTFHQAVMKKDGSPVASSGTSENKPAMVSQTVPSISVTTPAGHPSSSSHDPDAQLAYICGKNKLLMDTLSQNITPFLFTKTDLGTASSTSWSSIDTANNILQSKLFIFVFSENSINDLDTVKKLRLAYTHAVPLMYVREDNFTLPKPLPDFLFNKNINDDLILSRENSGIFSRARSVSPFVSAAKIKGHGDRRHLIRTPLSKSNTRVESSRFRRRSTEEKASNIGMQIMEGYRQALVYDDNNTEAFTKTLLENLSRILGQTFEVCREVQKLSSKADSLSVIHAPGDVTPGMSHHLKVPSSRGSLSGDDESFTMSEYGSYDEGLDQVFDDDLDNVSDWGIPEIDSGLSSPLEKETTYVVYPAAETRTTDDGPRMVRWPPKSTDTPRSPFDLDSFNPFFDSPVGFEDVDFDIVLDSDSPI